MASRYWVGNGGNWSDNANHWSATTGGAPGASLPTSTDAVFFDANSFSLGAQTVTLDVTASCLTMNWTNATNTPHLLVNNDLLFYGSVTFIAGMTVTGTAWLHYWASSGSCTFTSAGLTLPNVSGDLSGATFTLAGNLTTSGFVAGWGTFNTGNYNVVSTGNLGLGDVTGIAHLGTSTFTVTGFVQVSSNVGFTLDGASATFNVAGSFDGGGRTFGTVNLTGTGACTVAGSNTFATLATTASPKTIGFNGGTTQTVTNFNINGTAGNLINLNGFGAGWALSKTSGTVSVDYVLITNCAAAGGATWNAGTHSINGGLNTGWNFAAPATPYRYWVGNGGNWTDAAAHWSDSSGGAPGVGNLPTSSTPVIFDANSFSSGSQTVTINSAACVCASMNWTGATNSPTLAESGSNLLTVWGSATFIAGMTVTFSGAGFTFQGTTAGLTLATAGTALTGAVLTFLGAGSYTLSGALTATSLYVNAGSFTTGGNNLTLTTLTFSGGTLTLGTSVVTTSGACAFTAGNTLSAASSTINCSGNFSGGGYTFGTVSLAGTSACTVSGSNTFSVLSTPNHPKTVSFTGGTTQTVTTPTLSGIAGNLITLQGLAGGSWTISKPSGTVSIDYVYLINSAAAGGATWNAGANSTDGSGNTGWIFAAPPPPPVGNTRYWVGNGGNWLDNTNHWSASSGGSPGAALPTYADNVVFDGNSFSTSGQVVTLNSSICTCADMTWTGAVSTPTFAYSGTLYIYGSLTFIAGMVFTSSSTLEFRPTSPTKTIKSAGLNLGTILIHAASGGITLTDNLACQYVRLGDGITFSTGNYNITASMPDASLVVISGNPTIVLGTSTVTMAVWAPGAAILSAASSTINIYGSGTFSGGGHTYGTVNFTSASSNSSIFGSNTFGTMAVTANPIGLSFAAGTTQTVTTATLSGTAGNLTLLQGQGSGSWTISKPTGTVNLDYAMIVNSEATGGAVWYAGSHSVDGGGNTGWIFAAPPAPPAAAGSGSFKRTLMGMIANVQRSLRAVSVPIMEIHQALDTANKDIHLSYHWPWAYGDTNLLIQAPYTTGTISITDGTATITGALTVWDVTWTGMRIQFGTNNVDYVVASVDSPTQITLAQNVNVGANVVASTYTLYKDTYALPSDCDVAQNLMLKIQSTQNVVMHIPRYTFEKYALAQAQSPSSMTQFYADTGFDATARCYRIRFMPPISTVGEYRLVYRKRPPDLILYNAIAALPEGYEQVLELIAAAEIMENNGMPGFEAKRKKAEGKLRLMRRQVESDLIDNQPNFGMMGLPDQTSMDDYFTAQPWAGP